MSSTCPADYQEVMGQKGKSVAISFGIVALVVTAAAALHWKRVDTTVATVSTAFALAVASYITWVVIKIRTDHCLLATPCSDIEDLATGMERMFGLAGSVVSVAILVWMLRDGRGVWTSLGASTGVQLIAIALGWVASQWVRRTTCQEIDTNPALSIESS